MSSPVLVTGGTGTLGRLVVARLRDTGREVRVLSRTPHELGPGVDVVEGDGSSRTAASRSRRYGPPSSTSCCSSPSAR